MNLDLYEDELAFLIVSFFLFLFLFVLYVCLFKKTDKMCYNY